MFEFKKNNTIFKLYIFSFAIKICLMSDRKFSKEIVLLMRCLLQLCYPDLPTVYPSQIHTHANSRSDERNISMGFKIKIQKNLLLTASLKASTQNAMDINNAKISSEDLKKIYQKPVYYFTSLTSAILVMSVEYKQEFPD